MLAVPVPPPDSTTSGYSVPCTRNSNGGPSADDAISSRSACSNERMNSRPMILRFSSGSVTPASASRNCWRASTIFSDTPVAATKSCLDLLGLAGPQQAVVDEHAGQLVAHRALHQRRRDRRVDTAGQPADHPAIANLLADQGDLVVDDVGVGPVRLQSGDVVQEVPQHLLAVLGVQHLRVELHAGQPARRCPRTPRPARRRCEPVTVKPSGARVTSSPCDIQTCRTSGWSANSTPGLRHPQQGPAELRTAGVGHLAAERLGHRLEAVADPEHRHAGRRTAPGR